MTLQVDSWSVQGAGSTAQMARLQLQSASRSGNGIVESTDLEVTELDVPGGSVSVAAGAAIMLGQEAVFQGSYYAFNLGSEEVEITPTDSSGGRSDLVILRTEDPNIDGTPWTHDPATDQMYYFRVIEDVGSSATQLPANTTGVVLARIDIPASTATITQDLITDLRVAANPRSERVLRIQRGVDPIDYLGNIVTPSWENWPDPGWTIPVPAWATHAQIVATWGNADLVGGEDAGGWLRVRLTSGSSEILTPRSRWNYTWGGSITRHTAINAAEVIVPPDMRGTTASLYMQGNLDTVTDPGNHLEADGSSNFVVDIMWLEQPVPPEMIP